MRGDGIASRFRPPATGNGACSGTRKSLVGARGFSSTVGRSRPVEFDRPAVRPNHQATETTLKNKVSPSGLLDQRRPLEGALRVAFGNGYESPSIVPPGAPINNSSRSRRAAPAFGPFVHLRRQSGSSRCEPRCGLTTRRRYVGRGSTRSKPCRPPCTCTRHAALTWDTPGAGTRRASAARCYKQPRHRLPCYEPS